MSLWTVVSFSEVQTLIRKFWASRAIKNQNGLPWVKAGDSRAPFLWKAWKEDLCHLGREGAKGIQALYKALNPMPPKVFLSGSGILWCCVFFSSSHVILFSPGCTQMYVQISLWYLNLALGVPLPWLETHLLGNLTWCLGGNVRSFEKLAA